MFNSQTFGGIILSFCLIKVVQMYLIGWTNVFFLNNFHSLWSPWGPVQEPLDPSLTSFLFTILLFEGIKYWSKPSDGKLHCGLHKPWKIFTNSWDCDLYVNYYYNYGLDVMVHLFLKSPWKGNELWNLYYGNWRLPTCIFTSDKQLYSQTLTWSYQQRALCTFLCLI